MPSFQVPGQPVRLQGGGDPTVDPPLGPRALAARVDRHPGQAKFEGTYAPARADFTGVASRAALVDTEVLDRMLARPMWHGHRTPPEVAEAWEELQPHVDRLLELGDDALHIDALVRQDEQEAADSAYEAVKAGKRPGKVKQVDREAERAAIVAEAAGILRHVRQLRRQYDAVVKRHAEQWRESLTADYGTLQPAALAAWHTFRGQLGQWQGRVQALAAMNSDMDSQWTPYRSSHLQRSTDGVTAGIAAIENYVSQGDVNMSGAFVCDPLHVDPPVWWRRERFLQGDPQQLIALGQTEADEGFRFTSFTAPDGGQV